MVRDCTKYIFRDGENVISEAFNWPLCICFGQIGMAMDISPDIRTYIVDLSNGYPAIVNPKTIYAE